MNKNELKTEMPLISIVVPVYNGERYLAECIDSISKQDYTNIEIIIVDDGSIDNSGKIADDLANKDNRIKVIHQKNSGVSMARNMALDNIRGKYICLIDQDDYVEKNYVSYFYNLILENDAQIAITPTVKKFNELTKNDIQNEKVDKVEIWDGMKAASEMLYYNVVIAPWNKMISCELIFKNNIRFDSRFFSGEGFLFSIECFQRSKRVAVGHKKVYCYRVDNPDSGMTKFSMSVINSSIQAQSVIKSTLINETPGLIKACRYANWHTHCDCLNTIIGCKVTKQNKQKYKEIKKVCRKDALCVFGAPIPTKEKIKGILYFVNPFIASKIINRFRLRKFTKDV